MTSIFFQTIFDDAISFFREFPIFLEKNVLGVFPDVAFYCIPNKRCNSAWVGLGGDRPTVLRPGFQSRKRLFTVFFNSSGLVALDILPEKTTVTAKYYTEVVLPKVEDSICEQRPTIKTSKTLHLNDNAAPTKPSSPRPT